MSASIIDPDVKKAIDAHREKTIAANQQISILNAQIDSFNVKFRRSELVEKELRSLPDDVITYQASGRMFVKKSIPSLVDGLIDERKRITENIENAQKSRESVNNSLGESKEALRELLSSKQS